MFEKAARAKIRFDSPRGLLTVEDLFTLPLKSASGKANLDDIARQLSKELKSSDTESFVDDTVTVDSTVSLKLDIVKHVISVLKVEAAEREKIAANRDKKQHILSIIARKQDDVLGNASLEELTAMLNTL